MKKFMSIALGMGLVLGSAVAQDKMDKKADTMGSGDKMEKKGKKKKSSKKMDKMDKMDSTATPK